MSDIKAYLAGTTAPTLQPTLSQQTVTLQGGRSGCGIGEDKIWDVEGYHGQGEGSNKRRHLMRLLTACIPESLNTSFLVS